MTTVFNSSCLTLNTTVIDFGFAKKVPYTTVNSYTGEVKTHSKTFTLCGTPGIITGFCLAHIFLINFWMNLLIMFMSLRSPVYRNVLYRLRRMVLTFSSHFFPFSFLLSPSSWNISFLSSFSFSFSLSLSLFKYHLLLSFRIISFCLYLIIIKEYLSPELVFNLGHDQSSDLWALGNDMTWHQVFS